MELTGDSRKVHGIPESQLGYICLTPRKQRLKTEESHGWGTLWTQKLWTVPVSPAIPGECGHPKEPRPCSCSALC